VDELQRGGRESPPNPFPAVIQRLQEEVLEDMMQHSQPHFIGWVPALLGGDAWNHKT